MNNKQSVLDYIRRKTPNLNKYITIIYIFKLFFLGITLVSPFLYEILIDRGFLQKNGEIILIILVLNIVIFFSESLMSYVNMRIDIKYNNLVKLNVSTSIFENIIKTPYYKYEKYNIGEVKQIIDEESGVFTKFIQTQIIDKYYNYAFLISSTICMLRYNLFLTVFSWIMIPLSFFFSKILSKKSKEINENWRNEWNEYEGWLINNLVTWKEIKINNYSKKMLINFIRKWKMLAVLLLKKQLVFIVNYSLNEFKDTFLIKMNIYFIGALLIINGNLSLGALLAFMQYYDKAISCVSNINLAKFSLSEIMPAINRIIEIDQKINNEVYSSINYDINYNNIKFYYNSNTELVFSNLSLSIPYGSKVLIKGESGSGKTTLIKLLLGLYEPINGEVLIGNLPASYYSNQNNDTTLGAVMQDGFLFNLSINDNFKLIKPNITKQEIINACQKAQILDFINSLPEKYDTVLHENANNISGGQKQRLSLALVIAQSPLIAIFDEVTSALDIETETIIHKIIQNEFKNKTIINISHTDEKYDEYDMIVHMKNGKIEIKKNEVLK